MAGFYNGQIVYADNIDFSGGANPTAQMTVDGQLLIGNTGGNPQVATLASADGSMVITNRGGSIDLSAVGVDRDNMLYVGKHGNDANDGLSPGKAKLTIQAAVTAASAGDTIIVHPGTYTETVTHAANNVTIIAEGKPNTCIITQADANVVNFATYTGIQYKNFKIQCTAATTAIWTVEGTTGNCSFKECQVSMTSAADIAAAAQPGVGHVTGAGTLTFVLGKLFFYHTGNGGGTAIKAALEVANGGTINVEYINEVTITNSGTALASSLAADLATTGVFRINDSIITVTDPNATIVAGFAYVGGTGTDHEYYRNTVHVVATNNTGYGFYSSDTATTSRFFYNHIHVTDVAGTSYSYHIGNTSTVVSHFDDIIAADGYDLVGGGTFTEVTSESEGNLSVSALTQYAPVLGGGSGPLTTTAALTNGQLLIGNTGNAPSLATLTAGTGVSITNAAGSITINTIGGGMTWNAVSAGSALAINNGYLCIGGAALSFSLPATSAVGDEVSIALDGSTSWTITQGAGQQIQLGSSATTAGAGGSLASTAQGDSITMVCNTADTLWTCVSVIGNITVV